VSCEELDMSVQRVRPCPTLDMLHYLFKDDAVIRRPAKVSVFIRMSFLVKLKSRYQQIIFSKLAERSSQTETMYYRPDAFAGGFEVIVW
jgi:hypothetical protein